MAFSATVESTGDIVKIALAGDLDASTAADFKAKVEEAAALAPKKLVLLMDELDYMASAGLRVLIFAKQKMGNEVGLYVVGCQELVKETITKTGFNHSVYLLESYDAAQIEG